MPADNTQPTMPTETPAGTTPATTPAPTTPMPTGGGLEDLFGPTGGGTTPPAGGGTTPPAGGGAPPAGTGETPAATGTTPAGRGAAEDLFGPTPTGGQPATTPPATDRPATTPTDTDLFKELKESAVLREAGGLASDQNREWIDNTGQYKTRGRLIAFLDGHVRLLKENGRTTTVPLVRLSENDLDFVNRQASAQRATRYGETVQASAPVPLAAN
jgi:hypothetical protein